MILESEIQRKIIKKLTDQGWYVVKIIQTNKNGFPDLMCLKSGRTIFIEVKRPEGKPRPLQVYRMKEIMGYGFECYVMSSIHDIVYIDSK